MRRDPRVGWEAAARGVQLTIPWANLHVRPINLPSASPVITLPPGADCLWLAADPPGTADEIVARALREFPELAHCSRESLRGKILAMQEAGLLSPLGPGGEKP